jgi:uncharacterized protein (DUF934 family)
MSVIITDAVARSGFAADDWNTPFVALAEIEAHHGAVDLASTDAPAALIPYFNDLRLIRVAFPAFGDGRGFTIGRQLRLLGYRGRLRAFGHVIADQYAMARRLGFDEVEIPDDIAARQPADQWAFRANWRAYDYQSRLRA